MTYIAGGLIQATDYNGFASTTAGANVNNVWGPGSGDSGYGQTTVLTPVATGGTVTATQWATLNNRITSIANHQGTTITSRTSPVSTNLITILANLNTDLVNCTTARGNAFASGPTSTTWSGTNSKTATTGGSNTAWTITFTNTVTFASGAQANYFWNSGGLVRLDMSKTSTGFDSDPDWNAFIAQVGTLYLSGRINASAQTIAGTSYTGFTRFNGTGTPSPFLSTTGWYNLVPSGSPITLFTLTNTASAYSGDFVQITAAATTTTLTFVTTWYSAPRTSPGETTTISGGTATNSPFSAFGTAPTVLCRVVSPETTFLTNTWGNPLVTSSVA